MPDEERKSLRSVHSPGSEREVRDHPETNFLPPLKMVLAFPDQEEKQKDAKREELDERNIEKLIEKLSEKEE
jgi:hypothetical protein